MCVVLHIIICVIPYSQLGCTDMSDKASYIMGDAMIAYGAGAFIHFVLILVSTRLLVSGRETVTQAILAGMRYMGQSMSRLLGLVLIQYFGVTANLSTGHCNYDYYPHLLGVAHVLIPSLLFPAAYALLR